MWNMKKAGPIKAEYIGHYQGWGNEGIGEMVFKGKNLQPADQ